MKRNSLMILVLWLLAGIIPAVAQTNEPADYSKVFKDDKEKINYAIGMFFSDYVKRMVATLPPDQVDMNVIEKTLMDTLNGVPTRITQPQEQDILKALSAQIRAQQMEKQKALGETNLKEGAEFLAKNKNQPGVNTLANGLQYKVLTAGTGELPKPSDTVKVNYKGTLLDGTVFDSSDKQGHPVEFQVNRVIPGWTQALELMPVGSSWQLFIPAELAYGQRGNGPVIGPNATLIFEVELLATKPGASEPPAQMTSDIIKVPSAEGLKNGEKIETLKASDVEKMTSKTNN
jgi:FKBP-type peptidyl-prolyl cis-trans isomerase FklB